MPFPGEVVPLSHQISDGDNTLVIKASVVDDTGTVMPGSPFTLANVGSGKYTNNSLIMPANVLYLEITYNAYLADGATPSKWGSWGSVAAKQVVQSGTLSLVQVERIEAVVRLKPKITAMLKPRRIAAVVKEC